MNQKLELPADNGSELLASEVEIVPLHLDEPLHGSPLAMLAAAVGCNALVTAEIARADLTDLLPQNMPWITWLTTSRIPAFAAAGPNDALLLADAEWRSRAIDAGWPADRVEVAGCRTCWRPGVQSRGTQ